MDGWTHRFASRGSRYCDGRRLFSLEGDFGGISVRVCLPRLILFCLTLAATLSIAPSAHAHLVNTGFGPFDDGLTHLFVTPEDLLPVIALALLAGLRGPRFGRAVLFALPVAWLAGSTIGLLLAPPITLPLAETILTIALGLLLATESRLSLASVDILAILLGLLHGLLNGSELPKTSSSSAISVAGVGVALFVAVSLLAGQSSAVHVPWGRVAVRVAGSWIVAIGLLMLGWAMRASV
jgi:hydrogenase/urease accessory protein HupE